MEMMFCNKMNKEMDPRNSELTVKFRGGFCIFIDQYECCKGVDHLYLIGDIMNLSLILLKTLL